MKLSRKVTIIVLAILGVLASLYTAYASNYFFNIVLNKGIITEYINMLVAFPAIFLALTFVLGFFYVLRLYKRPNTFKRLSRLYLILNMVMNSLGFITSILTGVLVYGNMFSKYPFPGYPFVFMMFHLVLLGLDIAGLILLLSKAKEDEEKFKVKVSYIFKTIGWFLFACLAFNRFGTLLVAPMYIHWRTLPLTFVFYLFLLVPALLGIYKVLVDLGVLKNKIVKIVVVGCVFGYAMVTGLTSMILGLVDPVFVSAVSVSMPLERLASLPVEFPIHILAYIAVSVVLLVYAIKTKKEETK